MADVSRYYEANTRWFLRFGQTTGGPGVIHRGIWGDGVTTTLEALDHVHRLIQARVPSGTRVLDLGCGVGGSLCRLVELDPTLKGTGVTISPTQARLAAQRGPGQRFLTADFHDLPASLGTFDAAYAIEAWAHATDPDAFMASTARRLAPGGLLLLIDDFVGDDGGPVGAGWRATFAEGWHLGSLLPPSDVAALAERHGLTLEEDVDLTPLLRLWRPRDRALALVMRLFGWLPVKHPYWASLRGGDALQHCLDARWVTYRLLAFRLTSRAPDAALPPAP